MNKKITVLPGDGIGPEVIAQAIKVIHALEKKINFKFELQEELIGGAAMDQGLEPLPENTLKSCTQADAILFGAIGDPKYDQDPEQKIRPEQGLLQLRKTLGLYANIRPIAAYRKLHALSPLKEEQIQQVNLIIYRELTGGLYFGKKEMDPDGQWARDECYYHRDEIEKVAHLAFKHARLRRKKLTLVDKANVLETGKLWRATVRELQRSTYPDIELDLMYIDNAAMQLVLNPRQFDIILTENMFGDILSDEASVIVGTIGLLPSASYSETQALFEPIHGSYPQAAGRNIANPLATILATAMMLDYFDMDLEAKLIRDAVDFVITEGLGTMDMAPKTNISCSLMGDFIADLIQTEKSEWPQSRKILQEKLSN